MASLSGFVSKRKVEMVTFDYLYPKYPEENFPSSTCSLTIVMIAFLITNSSFLRLNP